MPRADIFRRNSFRPGIAVWRRPTAPWPEAATELPRKNVGPGGIVSAPAYMTKPRPPFRDAALHLGLEVLGTRHSRLTGAEGNQEYFPARAKKEPGVESQNACRSPPCSTPSASSPPATFRPEGVVPPLLRWLEARGIRACTTWKPRTPCPISKGRDRLEVAEESQLLLVLGGDGTLLARLALLRLSVSPFFHKHGRLGFLTSFKLERNVSGAGRHSEGKIFLQRSRHADSSCTATPKSSNVQAVVQRSRYSQRRAGPHEHLQLRIDRDFVCRYRADA